MATTVKVTVTMEPLEYAALCDAARLYYTVIDKVAQGGPAGNSVDWSLYQADALRAALVASRLVHTLTGKKV